MYVPSLDLVNGLQPYLVGSTLAEKVESEDGHVEGSMEDSIGADCKDCLHLQGGQIEEGLLRHDG